MFSDTLPQLLHQQRLEASIPQGLPRFSGMPRIGKNRGAQASPLKTRTPGLFRAPAKGTGSFPNGGAGIRTPVRDKIDHSVYVRVPPIEVSSRWPVDSPLLDKSSKLSPTTGRRSSRLSRVFDTLKAASGGLLYGQVQ